MLKAIRVSAMLLALVSSVYAGEVLTPPAPQSTPDSATQEPTDGVTLQGDMPNGVADSLTQTALELLALLPSLF